MIRDAIRVRVKVHFEQLPHLIDKFGNRFTVRLREAVVVGELKRDTLLWNLSGQPSRMSGNSVPVSAAHICGTGPSVWGT